MPVGFAELEGVLEKIGNRRSKQLPIAVDRQIAVNRMDRQLEPITLSVHDTDNLHFLHELGHGNRLKLGRAGLQPNFDNRSVYQGTEPGHTPSQHGAGTPAKADLPFPNDRER